MQLQSFGAVVFTLLFMIPGFVWSATLSMLVPRRPRQYELRFLEFFTLSCINNAFHIWYFYYFWVSGYYLKYPFQTSLWLLLALLLSPFVLGLATGYLAQREAITLFLRRFGFRTIHYAPTAWDWFFAKSTPQWVRVTLKDGQSVLGRFGEKSFAGSDPSNRDLYLEETFAYQQHGGKIEPVERTNGVLIMSDEIAIIEFYKDVTFERPREVV